MKNVRGQCGNCRVKRARWMGSQGEMTRRDSVPKDLGDPARGLREQVIKGLLSQELEKIMGGRKKRRV